MYGQDQVTSNHLGCLEIVADLPRSSGERAPEFRQYSSSQPTSGIFHSDSRRQVAFQSLQKSGRSRHSGNRCEKANTCTQLGPQAIVSTEDTSVLDPSNDVNSQLELSNSFQRSRWRSGNNKSHTPIQKSQFSYTIDQRTCRICRVIGIEQTLARVDFGTASFQPPMFQNFRQFQENPTLSVSILSRIK